MPKREGLAGAVRLQSVPRRRSVSRGGGRGNSPRASGDARGSGDARPGVTLNARARSASRSLPREREIWNRESITFSFVNNGGHRKQEGMNAAFTDVDDLPGSIVGFNEIADYMWNSLDPNHSPRDFADGNSPRAGGALGKRVGARSGGLAVVAKSSLALLSQRLGLPK